MFSKFPKIFYCLRPPLIELIVSIPVQGEEGSGEGGSGDGGTPGECPVQFMFRNVYCQDGGEVLDDALCQEPDPEDGSPVAGEKPNVFKSCQEELSEGTDDLDEPQVSPTAFLDIEHRWTRGVVEGGAPPSGG